MFGNVAKTVAKLQKLKLKVKNSCIKLLLNVKISTINRVLKLLIQIFKKYPNKKQPNIKNLPNFVTLPKGYNMPFGSDHPKFIMPKHKLSQKSFLAPATCLLARYFKISNSSIQRHYEGGLSNTIYNFKSLKFCNKKVSISTGKLEGWKQRMYRRYSFVFVTFSSRKHH